MKINTSAVNRVLNYTNYLIGGSYVVNPETANDIDLIVHEYNEERITQSMVNNGFTRLQKGDKKYDEMDGQRIISIYEGRIDEVKYNVIVVGSIFWPAYIGAIKEMRDFPTLYTERSSRVALHRSVCKDAAKMAGVVLPDSAY